MSDDDLPLVLCVDDEENILKSLKRTLRGLDCRVATALSGAEALEFLAANTVDLVISDQRMPEMNGAELLRQVKGRFPDVSSIMLSGYSDFESLVAAVNEGEIIRYVSKPWNNDELKDIVVGILNQRRAVEEVQRIVKNVQGLMVASKKLKVETSRGPDSIDLAVEDEGQVFSGQVITDILKVIYDTIGVDDAQQGIDALSGAISRQKGCVTFTIDIGKGVKMNVQIPSSSSPASS